MAQRRKRQRFGVNLGLNRPHGSDGLADPYFLNGRELAVEAQRAVSLGDRNPKFWRQVIERARIVRDVTSVPDLCALLDSLVSVNIRHTDLLQLLTREFIDDMNKATGDELASILTAYSHFQCKSETLLIAAQGQLQHLLDGDGVPPVSLATILRSLRNLDFTLEPALATQCRSLCHQYVWDEPAFASLDEVVIAYDGIGDPVPVTGDRTLPAWAESGSLQSAASMLLEQGHNASIAKPLLQKLVSLDVPECAQSLPSTVASFGKRDMNPLTPLWDFDRTPAVSSKEEVEEEFELQADWDDKETTSAPAPKTAYHFQWYNHITRQVVSQKPSGHSSFDPHAVRQRHATGRVIGKVFQAFELHGEVLERNDELRQLVQKFVNRTLEVVPIIAKNLHPDDLHAVIRVWTKRGVQSPEAWRPVALESVRKFVRFDGAAVGAIRTAIRSWPEMPHAALLNRSIKRWGLRKVITEKQKNL